MTAESQALDPYEAVLADLRAKRDQLDQTIKFLEGQRDGASTPTVANPSQNVTVEGGAFLGLTIAEAAKKLLATRKTPLGNSDILAGLKAGGLPMQAANPLNIVGSVLYRRFTDVGDIVRVRRGVWGLAEWYPNRSFKKKERDDEGEAATPADAKPSGGWTSEPAPPSKPTLVAAKG